MGRGVVENYFSKDSSSSAAAGLRKRRVTHISKAGADIGTDRSFVWAFDILILAL